MPERGQQGAVHLSSRLQPLSSSSLLHLDGSITTELELHNTGLAILGAVQAEADLWTLAPTSDSAPSRHPSSLFDHKRLQTASAQLGHVG